MSAFVVNSCERDTYSAVSRFEPTETLVGLLELVGWQLLLVDLTNELPKLLVLGLEDQDEPGGLRVEGAGHVEEGVLDDTLDARVGDGRGVAQLVVGVAVGNSLEEVRVVGHVACLRV